MKFNSVLVSFIFFGLMAAWDAPLKVVTPQAVQASAQETLNTPAGSYSGNPTTGGGYQGNWLCLNNPAAKCQA
ncbi:MAG: hypothetical protein LDL41_22225 [Coleofasciculus sp. S288]|nr:hypothetical protein [Coleofasciculus sp. S288]